MTVAALQRAETLGLAPMQCHAEVLVTPSQGQKLKLMTGGPIWANWDGAHLARHRREGEVADLRPMPAEPTARWTGDHVWGGQLIPHFGHLVAEHATRLAQSVQERPDDPALFILQKNMAPDRVPGFVWAVLDWLGYPRSHLRIVQRPITAERLWVAPQAEMLGEIAPPSAYLDLLERNAAAKGLRAEAADLVYVTRAALASPQAGRLLGEAYLCQALTGLGVAVCRPETLTLADQLAIYAGAGHLIFAEGSALHGRQLLGRIDQQITVLNRRPGWRIGAAALGARARDVQYHDICPAALTPKTTTGEMATALGASVMDAKALLDVFEAAGVPLRRVWDDRAFQHQVETDLRLWLEATFGASRVPIDRAASAKAISAQLQNLGMPPLDHWLAGAVQA